MEKGFSLYLGASGFREDQYTYMQTMSEAGFTVMFTSLHIPEENGGEREAVLKGMMEKAAKWRLEVVIDVAPDALSVIQSLRAKPTALRLDHGFSIKEMTELARCYRIAFNASTMTETFAADLQNAGVDPAKIEVWHNYYPRPETGLSRDEVKRRNERFRAMGFKTAAFVPGDKDLRGPVKAGLPSAEDHRSWAPYAAARDLTDELATDLVMVGDPGLTEHSISSFQSDEARFRAEFETELSEAERTIAGLKHKQRPDPARDVVRSEPSRSEAKKHNLHVLPRSVSARRRGDVTIDNENYGRYQGELQLVKTPLNDDPRVNTIGQITESDLPLLDLLQPGEKFLLCAKDQQGK
ncbi:MupG family TIM beta-alpha barrel fold protein [Salisediminibacterium halotolerans]|uniref:MupG family TIM beta-alpha barrel fold protein n=1 Tax=Salisediminibacterium halotolerans TaxID=517425 RepID=UPI000F1EC9AE|nr:MupG family TIM beta-alpha barrel fold protein [Salisediminibacterium halotolerans]RLJ75580.1 hypothetical protein BCL39_1097 [Actinophytocola xinjiangensis]RPE89434.1 hypothetical protein EDD67_0210 [Salisediminibacterium halotolerans]TWG36193.1 hypothetical protein BCL52_1094 [Salisediminibacterium halotolerans]GEL08178.1 hypothetical protein SHA02_15940 [Salisediminibacterium halotolerans]